MKPTGAEKQRRKGRGGGESNKKTNRKREKAIKMEHKKGKKKLT
jgi:hypothetical protein